MYYQKLSLTWEPMFYIKKTIKKQRYIFHIKFHHEVHKGLELMIFE